MTEPFSYSTYLKWYAGNPNLAVLCKTCNTYVKAVTFRGDGFGDPRQPGAFCFRCKLRCPNWRLQLEPEFGEQNLLCEQINVVKLTTENTVNVHGNKSVYTRSVELSLSEIAIYRKKYDIYLGGSENVIALPW